MEVHGVYFDLDHQPLSVGVGYAGLDVRLEGSLDDFDRWSLELTRLDGGRYRIQNLDQVDMIRLPGPVWWNPWGRKNRPVLGARLGGGLGTRPDSISGPELDLALLQIGGMRRSRHVGRWKIYQVALVVHSAYNLLRLGRLEALVRAAGRPHNGLVRRSGRRQTGWKGGPREVDTGRIPAEAFIGLHGLEFPRL